jgi:hypothetical protein
MASRRFIQGIGGGGGPPPPPQVSIFLGNHAITNIKMGWPQMQYWEVLGSHVLTENLFQHLLGALADEVGHESRSKNHLRPSPHVWRCNPLVHHCGEFKASAPTSSGKEEEGAHTGRRNEGLHRGSAGADTTEGAAEAHVQTKGEAGVMHATEAAREGRTAGLGTVHCTRGDQKGRAGPSSAVTVTPTAGGAHKLWRPAVARGAAAPDESSSGHVASV